MNISNWMSWEGGVDLMALTAPVPHDGPAMPNVIVHVARMVHTPVGSAPSGMILIPDFENPDAPPQLMGFVSSDPQVGAYFGAHIFAGTPFEHAPVHQADIEVTGNLSAAQAHAKVTVGDVVVEVQMTGLVAIHQINRPIGAMPFTQQGLESNAQTVQLSVNGKVQAITPMQQALTGGFGAVFSTCGSYAR